MSLWKPSTPLESKSRPESAFQMLGDFVHFLIFTWRWLQEYEASAKRKREESRALVEGAGSDFMKNLGHVQRIELLHGLNDMTSELKSFLVIISLCFIVLWNVSLNCCWFWSLFSLLDKTDLCLLSSAFFFCTKQEPFGESGRTVTSADIHDFFQNLSQKRRRRNWH